MITVYRGRPGPSAAAQFQNVVSFGFQVQGFQFVAPATGTTGYLKEFYWNDRLTHQSQRMLRFGFKVQGTSGGIAPPAPPVVYPAGGGPLYDLHIYKQREQAKAALPKRERKLVDELDGILAELHSRIEDKEEAPAPIVAKLNDGYLAAEAAISGQLATAKLRSQIEQLRAAVDEMDDEEVLLMVTLH